MSSGAEPPASGHGIGPRGWSHFVHGADIGIEGRGGSMTEAFEQAALALTAVITELHSVRGREEIRIECEAPDPELLLVDWLNALIYEMAVRRMLFRRFSVTVEGARLRATAWGESLDADRHQPAVEIKGATYTQLSVTENDAGTWIARCVVDV
jgi:SHS2 domain-containing protein